MQALLGLAGGTIGRACDFAHPDDEAFDQLRD
jgi:hypothetical protein